MSATARDQAVDQVNETSQTIANIVPRHFGQRLADFFALCKPRVNSLIVFTAMIGMFLASPDFPPLGRFLAASVGIALVAGAAAAAIALVAVSSAVPIGLGAAGSAASAFLPNIASLILPKMLIDLLPLNEAAEPDGPWPPGRVAGRVRSARG